MQRRLCRRKLGSCWHPVPVVLITVVGFCRFRPCEIANSVVVTRIFEMNEDLMRHAEARFGHKVTIDIPKKPGWMSRKFDDSDLRQLQAGHQSSSTLAAAGKQLAR